MRYFDPPVLDEQRQPLEPHNIISGSLPGATQIRIGGNQNILIDGLHQRITIASTDGSSVGIGSIPGDEGNSGFFSVDASGNLVQKIILGTWYVYDLSTNKNIMQSGKLPDNSYGQAIAKSGFNVSDGVS